MIVLAKLARRHPLAVAVAAAAVAGWLWLSRPFTDGDPAWIWWQSRHRGGGHAEDDDGDEERPGD